MTSLFFLSSAIRAGVVLLIGLVAATVLPGTSAATRRAVLVLALGASLVVPVVAAVVPSWHVETPSLGVFGHESRLEGQTLPGRPTPLTPPDMTSARGASTWAARSSLPTLPVALWSIWLVGVVMLAARALRSHRRARSLVARSVRASGQGWDEVIARAVREAGAAADVRLSDALKSPAVTGVLASTVLLPVSAEAWSDERRRVVLVHELAHVRQRDGVAQVVADAACAWSWFNPLVWRCAGRMRVERELAADDAVLLAGVRPSFYAEELLVHAGEAVRGALAMAERSSLGDRVVAILAAGRQRRRLAAGGKVLLSLASVVVAVAAACTLPTARAGAATTDSAIDPKMQAAAEEQVAALLRVAAGESATVVVLDPATGAVLADAGKRGGRPFDVARSQAMSPGSTLKAITLAAAIETNAITPGQLFKCGPEPRVYPEGEMTDASPHGTLDAPHMLAVSSNIGVSRVFDALGGERLADWLARFHFGHALALPDSASGLVPATVTTGTLQGAEVATGEGITATPLQIAAAYAALANDGVYHAPSFGGPATPAERLVSSSTAGKIMAMLATVVEDDSGTGKLARVEGAHVAGKTGTAGWTTPDGREHLYASFVGVADVAGRRIVALVGVETLRTDVNGGTASLQVPYGAQPSGPSTAAPAFARLVMRLR
jgi:beta-lactamase regulating signal transducer with metallopeptidase domain